MTKTYKPYITPSQQTAEPPDESADWESFKISPKAKGLPSRILRGFEPGQRPAQPSEEFFPIGRSPRGSS